jgi:hypothetical protein
VKRSRGASPKLFGVLGRWSERQRCWSWRSRPLTACAYQTPTGGWWISGTVNSFPMASRPQATLQRAIADFERHLRHLHKTLGKLIEGRA